jgi:hypothetical protein
MGIPIWKLKLWFILMLRGGAECNSLWITSGIFKAWYIFPVVEQSTAPACSQLYGWNTFQVLPQFMLYICSTEDLDWHLQWRCNIKLAYLDRSIFSQLAAFFGTIPARRRRALIVPICLAYPWGIYKWFNLLWACLRKNTISIKLKKLINVLKYLYWHK